MTNCRVAVAGRLGVTGCCCFVGVTVTVTGVWVAGWSLSPIIGVVDLLDDPRIVTTIPQPPSRIPDDVPDDPLPVPPPPAVEASAPLRA